MANKEIRQHLEDNFTMECYSEEDELEMEEDFSDDNDEESDENSDEGDLEREIIVRGNRPHQFEPLARDIQAVPRNDGDGGPALHQRRNTDANRLRNVNWYANFFVIS